MADTICFSLLGSARHKYGRQRMWGSLGWGLVGAVSGALVDLFSKGQHTVNYTPALIISSFFLAINFLVALRIPFKVPDREKLKASRVGRVLSSSRMLIYLTTVVVVGVNMGLYWTFLFIFVEDVASAWDPGFDHMKLLQGILLGTSCFLGEVPSLFLSPLIIKKLGNIKTFALALVGFTIRLFLYSSVLNPWLFIPIELTHGFSFGVFYPNMISYASLMAPKGAQATIQGIVKSLFVVGVSLGALLGGIMMTNVGGSKMFLYMGNFDSAFVVFYCVVQFAIHKMKTRDGQGEYGSTPEGLNGEVGKLKKRGLAADLAMEEQGSMCDLQVITPYPEVTEEEEEKLKEEMVT